jgi:hypothetical protein
MAIVIEMLFAVRSFVKFYYYVLLAGFLYSFMNEFLTTYIS